MSHTDLCWLPATEIARAIRTRQLSPVELVDALLSRIHQLNPTINAYCTLTEETARQAARAAEAAVLRGDDLGLVHGVPVSIKDLLFTSGVRTMRGSCIYEQFVPDQDVPAVAKLKASSAISICPSVPTT
jgi:Asp-tRNA(Asn)/Glu-tRNA(Gln) amidotransferase A subunit family amidase